jgi:uncharacterized protein YlxW (UPF0749 family)
MDASWVTKVDYELSDLKTRVAVAESDIRSIKDDIRIIKDNTTQTYRMLMGFILTVGAGIVVFVIQRGM